MINQEAIEHLELLKLFDCPLLLDAKRMAVAALREQEERRWIPVTERLPDVGSRVIACGEKGGVFVVKSEGITTGFGRMDGASKYRSFTHWMPLPEPPKEDVK